MSLPILSSHPIPDTADLVRFYYRTELHWARQLAAEEEVLDVGTALFNPALAEVQDANMLFDASLPGGADAAEAIVAADEFFASRGGRCRIWVPNPSAPADRIAPLVERLTERGYAKGGYDIYHLASTPQGPIKEIGGLTIIPARASFRHAREIVAEAATEWGCAQLGDAMMAHLEDPQTDALLAIQGGAAVGLVAVLAVGELGCIETLFVGKSHRGTGVGRTLMSRALEICARALFKHVFIAVDPANAPAVALYRKLGFERIGEFVAYREPSSSHAFT